MVSEAIRVIDLEKSYGNVHALKGVTFNVDYGHIVGYIGPNGAGKTTTIKIIAGILKPDSGDVVVGGYSVTKSPLSTKKLISYVPEDGGLFDHLTVMEHIELIAALRSASDAEIARGMELLDKFGLTDKLKHRISTLSKGNRQKLLIAGALMVDVDVYLLDEPLSGIDVTTSMEIKEMLREMAANGKAILFSSHILEMVERLCDRVVIIDKGKIIAEGEMEEIRHSATLEEFFSRLVAENNG